MKAQEDEGWRVHGSPFLGFTEAVTKEWVRMGFKSRWECKQWLDIGLKAEDCEYAKWLKDVENLTPEQVREDEAELHELFQEYKKQQTSQSRQDSQQQFQTQIEIPPQN